MPAIDDEEMPIEKLEQHISGMRDYTTFMLLNCNDFPDRVTYIESQHGLGIMAEHRAQSAEQAIELWCLRWLAVAMAWYRWLGSDSSIGLLDPEVIRTVTEREGFFGLKSLSMKHSFSNIYCSLMEIGNFRPDSTSTRCVMAYQLYSCNEGLYVILQVSS